MINSRAKLFLYLVILTTACGPQLGSIQAIESYSNNTQPIFESEPGINRMGDGAKRFFTGIAGDPFTASFEIFGGCLFIFSRKGLPMIGAGIARPFRGIGYAGIGLAEMFVGTGEEIGQWFSCPEPEADK